MVVVPDLGGGDVRQHRRIGDRDRESYIRLRADHAPDVLQPLHIAGAHQRPGDAHGGGVADETS
ncbi:hypothetical protein RZS08_03970, partial [Arthrospira platensis SPKY1]|nr:hypothetical protein [Arthrospira platensis SPKY1]